MTHLNHHLPQGKFYCHQTKNRMFFRVNFSLGVLMRLSGSPAHLLLFLRVAAGWCPGSGAQRGLIGPSAQVCCSRLLLIGPCNQAAACMGKFMKEKRENNVKSKRRRKKRPGGGGGEGEDGEQKGQE